MKFVINGDFVDKSITGVQRYAYEITKHIDSLLEEADYSVELLIPEDCKKTIELENIKVVHYGKNRRIIWQQICLPDYCRKNNAICICMCSVPPLTFSKNTILVVHDASMLVNPEYYSKKFLWYNKLFCWSQKNKLRRIITVSNFSRDELDKYWTKNKRTIEVIENAADHVKSIKPDEKCIEKFALKDNEYYYALSSLSPNKNFKWIINNAIKNPKAQYVVSGKVVNIYSQTDFGVIPDNVIFTGYVSDSEMVALMSHCKAFIFPTLYEGFGITPLEALELEKKIIISDIPVMREIYEDSAVYIDPYSCDYDIEELYLQDNRKKNMIIGKYTWGKSAQKFKSLMDDVYEELKE